MISFDKTKIKEELHTDNIFDLLQEWGGDPERASFGIISSTICHNMPGDGSRKLYYYENSGLFRCYTGCDATFDIFDLAIKIYDIQYGKQLNLNDAIRLIAARFGLSGDYVIEDNCSLDWTILDKYARLADLEIKNYSVLLPEYNKNILERLNYNVVLKPWLDEGITQEAINVAQIGYYPGADMISIPHFDINDRFIGLRGRAMAIDDIERFGKYRPIKIMQQLYNHPLGMNLYGLNWAKHNIKIIGKAIVFESEKSVLQYMSLFGIENSIAVACCGSSISIYQIQMLIDAGAKEIVIAFDRQFKAIGDTEFKHLTNNLLKLYQKYKNDLQISIIFDKDQITTYKASPIDEGAEKFLKLFTERIVL